MEDVLEVYHRPHDPPCPVVCVDETSKQLIVETRKPIPAKPGRPARYEYERNGTANLFMMFAPLEGWRKVKVTDRHAALDYAPVLKELSDIHFPAPRKSSSCRISQHSQTGFARRGFSRRRGTPPRQAVRGALHAQTRQLARYGRTRTRRPDLAVSRPTYRRQADLDRGSGCLGEGPQQEAYQG